MKNTFFLLILTSVLSIFQLKAQSFDMEVFDKAMVLINEGKQNQAAGLLEKAGNLLYNETKTQKNQFSGKIINQVSALSSLVPALSKGNANVGNVMKVLNTIKTLQAASNLSNLISGGLKGNGSRVASNIGVLKSGLNMLNLGGNTSKILGTLDKVSGKSSKLDKGGLFSGLIQKGVSKKLNSSLGLLNNML